MPPGATRYDKFPTEGVLDTKKLAACILALALAFTLPACGDNSGYQPLIHQDTQEYTENYIKATIRLIERGLSVGFQSLLDAEDLDCFALADDIAVHSRYYSLEDGEAREINYAEYTRPSGARLRLTLVAVQSGGDFRVYFYTQMPELPDDRGEQRLSISDAVLSGFSQTSPADCRVVYTHTETRANGELHHTAYGALPESLAVEDLGLSFNLPGDEKAQNLRALHSVDLSAKQVGAATGLSLDAVCSLDTVELPLSLGINYTPDEVTQ